MNYRCSLTKRNFSLVYYIQSISIPPPIFEIAISSHAIIQPIIIRLDYTRNLAMKTVWSSLLCFTKICENIEATPASFVSSRRSLVTLEIPAYFDRLMIMAGNRACAINYAKIRVVGTSNISLSRAIKLAKHFEIDLVSTKNTEYRPNPCNNFQFSPWRLEEKSSISYRSISFLIIPLSPNERMIRRSFKVTTLVKPLSCLRKGIIKVP